MKKILIVILSVMMMITVAGCGKDKQATTSEESVKRVGILMPKKESPRWIKDGNNLKTELEKRGYKVDLRNADNDADTQRAQLQEMLATGTDIFIIAAVDSTSLSDILIEVKEKNIPVIAYDRLIMNSTAVTYYITFDNRGIGESYGRFVEKSLGLNDSANTFNIEIFSGSADDNNARVISEGLMGVLQPYIDNGQLKVPSGKIEFGDTTTHRWRKEEAQNRMNYLLHNVYNDGTKLDAVICASDGIANGVIRALDSHHVDSQPIITGQDGDIAAVKYILEGKQSMTLFKDTRLLANQCARTVEAIFNGDTIEVNDTSTYNNNIVVVPTYLCQPILVTKDNIKEVLVNSGYYTAEELGI
ncbi:MAG: sugar-binding protein [Selenomonadaceae bacterium]|nr:sugar-binding protein [Selenomonadaceae bacterium]